MIRIFFSILVLGVLFFAELSISSAVVNYGTTTYFSDQRDATPPISQPILDPGGASKNWRPSDKEDRDNDPEDSIFDVITDKFQSLFGTSGDWQGDNEGKKESLFDFQDGDGSNDYAEEYFGEYIMGPRGESYENLDEEEAAMYKSRLAQNFNFGSEGKDVAPKKSKLLFTNVEINIDLTTQYVILGIVFFIATGLVVGYYFWKKEARMENKKYNSDDEL